MARKDKQFYPKDHPKYIPTDKDLLENIKFNDMSKWNAEQHSVWRTAFSKRLPLVTRSLYEGVFETVRDATDYYLFPIQANPIFRTWYAVYKYKDETILPITQFVYYYDKNGEAVYGSTEIYKRDHLLKIYA